ncbi:hypothetical protein D3C80_1010660 [compost metagenome]
MGEGRSLQLAELANWEADTIRLTLTLKQNRAVVTNERSRFQRVATNSIFELDCGPSRRRGYIRFCHRITNVIHRELTSRLLESNRFALSQLLQGKGLPVVIYEFVQRQFALAEQLIAGWAQHILLERRGLPRQPFAVAGLAAHLLNAIRANSWPGRTGDLPGELVFQHRDYRSPAPPVIRRLRTIQRDDRLVDAHAEQRGSTVQRGDPAHPLEDIVVILEHFHPRRGGDVVGHGVDQCCGLILLLHAEWGQPPGDLVARLAKR